MIPDNFFFRPPCESALITRHNVHVAPIPAMIQTRFICLHCGNDLRRGRHGYMAAPDDVYCESQSTFYSDDEMVF